MGVHGLWQVVHPVARPIALETLGNKKLAIDSSIWLYQFQLAMRDKEGRALANAHILGFLRRITKLLYYGIKPVFVFDGGAPVIKRSTLAQRKSRKRGNADTLAKTAEKLLAAQMRQAALAQAEKQRRSEYEGDFIEDDAVYHDDLPAGVQPRGAPEGSGPNHHQPQAGPSQTTPQKKKKKDYHKDQYALPALDTDMTSRAQLQDPRLATEEELRDFIEDLRPEDLDVDAEWFHGLSTEVQYEILGDLRLKSRQANFRRVEQMRQSATALDFSRAQIKHLMQRNDLTQKLLSVTDDISRAHIKIPIRIAAERNKHYVLVKNDAKDGSGGWMLGVRDPVQGSASPAKKPKPVKIDMSDTSDTESMKSLTDEGDFEEVAVPDISRSANATSPMNERRKAQAVEALQRRYSPSKEHAEEPLPQLPVQEPLFSPTKRTKPQSAQPVQLDEDLLAAAAVDSTLFNDIANAQLGQPSRTRDELQTTTSLDPQHEGPFRPNMPSHRPTTGNREANLNEQQISDDSDDDMEEVQPAVAVSTHHPNPREAAAQELNRRTNISGTSSTKSPPRQSPAPPPVRLKPTPSRATPQQASLNAQAKLKNATSFNSFANVSQSNTPFDDPSGGDLETADLDQGPSLISSALANESDSDEDFEPVAAQSKAGSQTVQTFDMPIQQAAQQANALPQASQATKASNASTSSAHQQALFQEEDSDEANDVRTPKPSPKASPQPLSVGPAPEAFETKTGPGRAFPHVPEVPHQDTRTELVEEDPEAVEGWSRSPSPVGRGSSPRVKDFAAPPKQPEEAPDYVPSDFPLAPEGRELDSDDELDAGDLEEAELTANIRAEEGHFSKFLDDLESRNLADMRAEVDAEIALLEQTRKTDRKNADEVTAQMSKEIMVMLRFFGIPFVVAPMEAEAQCAELARRSLVDGIITDDSDVFLFGGTRVYKNMFNQNKYVECYLLSDMERELSLSRDKLVQLAHFLGSDYCEGLPGVGPVLGMELMNEFPGEDGLVLFRKWWQKVQKGQDTDQDTTNAFRRRFKKSKKELFLDDYWPNPEIRKAYFNPTVDSSEERFQWGVPDLDGLRGFLAESLGWGVNKVDDLLTPLIRRMQQRHKGVANMQGSLDAFFDVTGGTGRFAPAKAPNAGQQSQRMQNVIKSWKAKQAHLASSDKEGSDADSSPPAKQPNTKRRRKPAKQASAKGRRGRGSNRAKSTGPTRSVPEEEPDEGQDEEQQHDLPRIARPRKAARRQPVYTEGNPSSSDSGGSDEFRPT